MRATFFTNSLTEKKLHWWQALCNRFFAWREVRAVRASERAYVAGRGKILHSLNDLK